MNKRSDLLDALAASQRQARKIIKDHGWVGVGIYDNPNQPGYTYTAGFWKSDRLPEAILYGVPHKPANGILWALYRLGKAKQLPPLGTPIKGLLHGDIAAYLFPVAKHFYPMRISVACWLYKGDGFPCVQIVWPDQAGRFPWDERCDPLIVQLQPDLTENGWKAALTN